MEPHPRENTFFPADIEIDHRVPGLEYTRVVSELRRTYTHDIRKNGAWEKVPQVRFGNARDTADSCGPVPAAKKKLSRCSTAWLGPVVHVITELHHLLGRNQIGPFSPPHR